MKNWMIYGANGYTGDLIARAAHRDGLKPILAGRNRDRITALARELNCESRIFSLDNHANAVKCLADVAIVAHCAGPFSATATPMLNACLFTTTHYLDITGEVAVLESIHARSTAIAAAGIVAIPGSGFDVVPTDCMAALLKQALPDASILRLGFKQRGGKPSAGTLKSMLERFPKGGMIRENHRLKDVPHNYKKRRIDFAGEPTMAVTIPWGDLSTAYYSTGIPNIECYMATASGAQSFMLNAVGILRPLLRRPSVQRLVKGWIGKTVEGPTADERARAETLVWGEVENTQGHRVSQQLRTPDGYEFTVEAVLAAVRKLQATDQPKLGAKTPSLAFGAEFVFTIPGVSRLL